MDDIYRSITPQASLSGCGSASRAPGSSRAYAAAPTAPAGKRVDAGSASAHPVATPQAGSRPRAASRAYARRSVGLRACLGDALDCLRIGEHDPADTRLNDTRDPKRAAGRLQRKLVIDGEALREERKRLRLRLHPPGEPHLTTLRDRHFAEVAMDVQANENASEPPSRSLLSAETRRATRQLRIRARGTPGQSQGRPPTNRGLAAHNASTACPDCVSLKPWHPERRRRYPASRMTQKLHPRSFMPLQPPPATPSAHPHAARQEPPALRIATHHDQAASSAEIDSRADPRIQPRSMRTGFAHPTRSRGAILDRPLRCCHNRARPRSASVSSSYAAALTRFAYGSRSCRTREERSCGFRRTS
jgi:hypothetical protein